MSAQASKEMVAGVVGESVDSSGSKAAKSRWEGISPTAQLVGLVIAVWGTLIVMMIWVSGIQASLVRENASLKSDLTAQISALKSEITAQMFNLRSDMNARISDLKTDLTEKIDVVDDRLKDVEYNLATNIRDLDAKLNAIGDMTVIAFTDGAIDSAELAAIWDRARGSAVATDELPTE